MKRIIKKLMLATLLVVAILSTIGAFASANTTGSQSAKPKTYRYGGVWLTVIKDLPPTVQVGKVYTVKLKYENRYRNRRNHHKKQPVKQIPWIEWGAYTYPHKGTPEHSGYWHSNKSRMKSRQLKPGQSRSITYKVSFNGCLPPWGQDWGGQPGDYFYSGLACASGRYYFRTSTWTKGYHWSNGMSYPFERNVYIVPASGSSATPAVSAPTGPTGPTG